MILGKTICAEIIVTSFPGTWDLAITYLFFGFWDCLVFQDPYLKYEKLWQE